jgi:signal peptidase I
VPTDPTDRPTAGSLEQPDQLELIAPESPVFAAESPSDPFQQDPETEAPRVAARLRRKKEDATRAFWKELPVLIVVALVVAVLIKTFLVQAFFIPSASMRDTLLEGDRVMVNKLAYRFGEPGHGDVVVFDSPLGQPSDGENFLGAVIRNIGESLGLSTPDTALIKRVIALSGDTIEIQDNTVFVNGAPIDEPYLNRAVQMPDFGPLEVPADHVFVMGDNRNQSEDSRRFGPVPESSIIGRAFVRVWPPSRWGGL